MTHDLNHVSIKGSERLLKEKNCSLERKDYSDV